MVLADFDGDGWPDIFVANDSAMNFFYRNQGNGTFKELGLASGAGFTEDGQTEAGMGVDAAYLEGDASLPDLYVTHLDNELNRLYRNLGQDSFRDVTKEAGLGGERSLLSGFGVRFADFSNSGHQQILVANGHILDNIALFHPRVSYREPMTLLEGVEGLRFRQSVAREKDVLAQPLLGRGLAVGDFNADGLLDFVVNQNAGPPLIAESVMKALNHWIAFDLRGTGRSNRDAVGTEVTITAGGKKQRAQIMGGTSYCSASHTSLHFGLGAARLIDRVVIHWPSGHSETWNNLPVDQTRRITESVAAQ